MGVPLRTRLATLMVPLVAPLLNVRPGGTLPATVYEAAALWAPVMA